MPYDNDYNRMIARDIDYFNRKYIMHCGTTGQGTIDYRLQMTGGCDDCGMQGAGAGSKTFHSGDDSSTECSSSDSDMEGGAILGLQAGTVLGGPKIKRNTRRLISSFSSLGAPIGFRRDINNDPLSIPAETPPAPPPEPAQVPGQPAVGKGGAILGHPRPFEERYMYKNPNFYTQPVKNVGNVKSSYSTLGRPDMPMTGIAYKAGENVYVRDLGNGKPNGNGYAGAGKDEDEEEDEEEEEGEEGGYNDSSSETSEDYDDRLLNRENNEIVKGYKSYMAGGYCSDVFKNELPPAVPAIASTVAPTTASVPAPTTEPVIGKGVKSRPPKQGGPSGPPKQGGPSGPPSKKSPEQKAKEREAKRKEQEAAKSKERGSNQDAKAKEREAKQKEKAKERDAKRKEKQDAKAKEKADKRAREAEAKAKERGAKGKVPPGTTEAPTSQKPMSKKEKAAKDREAKAAKDKEAKDAKAVKDAKGAKDTTPPKQPGAPGAPGQTTMPTNGPTWLTTANKALDLGLALVKVVDGFRMYSETPVDDFFDMYGDDLCDDLPDDAEIEDVIECLKEQGYDDEEIQKLLSLSQGAISTTPGKNITDALKVKISERDKGNVNKDTTCLDALNEIGDSIVAPQPEVRPVKKSASYFGGYFKETINATSHHQTTPKVQAQMNSKIGYGIPSSSQPKVYALPPPKQAPPKQPMMPMLGKGGKSRGYKEKNKNKEPQPKGYTLPPPKQNAPKEIATKEIASKQPMMPVSGKGKKSRADIVKQVMKEKGMSMIEASKHVKSNGLY